MFEIGGEYENRNGKYTVISFLDNKMTVRYSDGSEKNLNVEIQERIWENIVAEREAEKLRSVRKLSAPTANFFIKTLSVAEDSDLMIPGLKQRVAASSLDIELVSGDRIIYYTVEAKLFFAVATVTSAPRKVKAKDYLFGADPKASIYLYPIDVDAHIVDTKLAIPVDSAELESISDHESVLSEVDRFFSISEDDFELLAELIAEYDEEDDTNDDDLNSDEPEEKDVEDLVDLS